MGWELGGVLTKVGSARAGVVEEELYGDGLKTSSEPRESLGAGGMRGDCLLGSIYQNQIVYLK